MKLLKNLLALTLVLAMVLAFGACSDDKDASSASKDESKTEESSNASENSDATSDDSSVADDSSDADTSSDAVSDDSSAPETSDSETSDSETAALAGTYAISMDMAPIFEALMETEIDASFNVTIEVTFDGDKTATGSGTYDKEEFDAFINEFIEVMYNETVAGGLFEGSYEDFVAQMGGTEVVASMFDVDTLFASFNGEYACDGNNIAIKLASSEGESYLVGTFDDTTITFAGEYDAEGNLLDDNGFPMVLTKK